MSIYFWKKSRRDVACRLDREPNLLAPRPPVTAGAANKLITEGLFVFSFVSDVQMRRGKKRMVAANGKGVLEGGG